MATLPAPGREATQGTKASATASRRCAVAVGLALALSMLALAPAVSRAATCGNGVLEEGEDCDGADFGGLSCDDFCAAGSTLAPPGLSCTSCRIDTTPCWICGNNRVDAGNGEVCDGTALNGQ